MTLDEKGIDVPNGQATCMADFAKSAWLENLGRHPFDTLSTNHIETSSADFWKNLITLVRFNSIESMTSFGYVITRKLKT